MTLRHTRGPLASHGQDSVEFYISTNPGEDPKPLAKIASGGELSRITLAIKNAMADKDAVPTVIYDEIDSGVSGKAASRIGEVLKQSAKITRSSASLTQRRSLHWPTAICLSRKISRMSEPIPRSTRWIPRAEWTRWRILFPVTMSRSFPVPMPERCWGWLSMKPVIDNPADLC